MDHATRYFSHNPRQAAVVAEYGQCCLVTAIPGSGKTKTVTDKIVHLLRGHERGLWRTPKRVMAVTFTSEAGQELTERATAAAGADALERLQTGTFHGLLLAALKRIGSEVTHRRIATAGQTEQYRERALNAKSEWFRKARALEEKAQHYALFERARCVVTDPYGIEEAEREGKNSSAERQLKDAVEHYKKLMKENRLMDFAMIMEESLAYLRSSTGEEVERTPSYLNQRAQELAQGTAPSHSEELTDTFLRADHAIVDESQDTDEYQLCIILEIADRGVIVDMVGDDDQSIYMFRHGLGYAGMQTFLERTGARHFVLDINYRCRDEVLELAGQIIRQNTKRHDKELTGTRGSGGIITLDVEDTGAGELRRVQDSLTAMFNDEKAGKPVRTKAIIARVNRILDEYQVELSKANIKVERVGGGDLWGEAPVCFMAALIEGLTENSRYGIDQALHFAGVNPDWVDLSTMTLKAVNTKTEKAQFAVETLGLMWRNCRHKIHSAFPEHVTDAVAEIYGWFLGVVEHGKFSKAQKVYYAGRFRMAARVLGGDAAARKAEHASALKGEWKDREASQGTGLTGNLARRLRTVRMLDRTGTDDPAAVKIVSMHGAKGREWDVVFIVSCEDSIIPGRRSDDDAELRAEERRLLYVAITRARDELHLSWSRQRLGSEKEEEEIECRFLAALTRRPSRSLDVVHDRKAGITV